MLALERAKELEDPLEVEMLIDAAMGYTRDLRAVIKGEEDGTG
jgi:hypothetical protein